MRSRGVRGPRRFNVWCGGGITSGPATEKGYGFLRVYDHADLATPVQVGEFRTPNSLGPDDQAAGDYVIHNPFLDGQTLHVSWYSAACGVLTTRHRLGGVVVDDGLVSASDRRSVIVARVIVQH